MIDDVVSNKSGNTAFGEIASSRLSRRTMLGGSMAAAVGFFGSSLIGAGPAGARNTTPSGTKRLGFKPVPLGFADEIVVPEGYSATSFLPWGQPITAKGPAWAGLGNTAAEQGLQLGMGHDGMWFFGLGGGLDHGHSHDDSGNEHGILCINHEFTDEAFLHATGLDDWTAEKTLKSQAAHGVSVVEVKKIDGVWQIVDDGGYNRRITPNTPMAFTGPAAGHPLLRTAYDPEGQTPIGTVNNCGAGRTPWGTYITCEENFNGYFGSSLGEAFEPNDLQARYGLSAEGFGYNWYTTDVRWDLSAKGYENEHHRFGWQVEIDPDDPTKPPMKRTALGRFKHEGMAVVIGRNNRAVAYMGDDERFDYLYKFVSDKPYQWYLRRGMSPLDEGVLYVAQFFGNGKGTWLPLVHGHGPLTAENGFADQGEVLIKARLAADALGATPMDRPEWTTVAPDGYAYLTCTNNTRRAEGDENAANPRANNQWGHIIKWYDSYEHVGVNFHWDVFVLAGPGGGIDGSTNSASSAFGSPDGLWADPDGRLWIQTDGSQPEGANDQMLVADPDTGEIKRFLTAVVDCEVTGITITPDQRTMFVNIQHPGNGDPAASNWPSGVAGDIPRPATVIITKDDGGIIGS